MVEDEVDRSTTVVDKPRGVERDLSAVVSTLPQASMSITTAADALRDDDVQRMRLVIRLGWLLSVVAMGIVPFLDAPPAMDVALIAAGGLGIVVSFPLHQRFADPRNYTERAVVTLGVISTFNAAIAILYFGAFSVAPVIMVMGIHFVARSEHARAGRVLWGEGAVLHGMITVAITSGLVSDPGVFASDRPMSRLDLVLAGLFVQGVYALAYVTARAVRVAALRSIEQLHTTTRLAAKRSAMMEELRIELERALRVGGPGRYSEQTVGSFRLGVVIGRGAMGEVYEAARVTTGEAAAVKLLRRELLADPTQVARFLREARAGGTLASPHVVKILETAADHAELPYLAMERLRGRTLAELLRREPRLTPPIVVEMIGQVGEGVEAAAAAGIVHRDLKPQNLMLCDGPTRTWKILDFGIATLAEDAGTLTHGDVVGTPSYMAPEQARGERVDTRADLYALAAIVYRCLTGRHPFSGAETPALLYAVVHHAPQRPSALVDVHRDVDRWIARGMAKSRDDRFATAAELAAELALAFRGSTTTKSRKKADALIDALPWDDE